MNGTDSPFSSEAITRGIRVTVDSEFEPRRSAPDKQFWLFLYTVRINNEGPDPVQLLERHWIITNELGTIQEVQGSGVVGEQPTLAPGESFEYTSSCPLDTSTGFMQGFYGLVNHQGESFKARVEKFFLSPPFAVN